MLQRHNFIHSIDTALGIESLICTWVISMFNIVLAHIWMYVNKTKMDFISFDDKNL